MNPNKNKIIMLYPANSADLVLEIGVACIGVLLPLIVGLDTLSGISGDGMDLVLGLAMSLLFFSGAALVGILYWRRFPARNFLLLDVERGVLLYGRWGWQARQEYPLSIFTAVAAEKVWDDYRGYYGRLWLESADGKNDLVLEENFPSHKSSLQGLDNIQSHIARTTGLAKRPVINTEIRTEEKTAADLSKLRVQQPETLPVWRQAVNLAAAGLCLAGGLAAALGGGLAKRRPAQTVVFWRGADGNRAAGSSGIGSTNSFPCATCKKNSANKLTAAIRIQGGFQIA